MKLRVKVSLAMIMGLVYYELLTIFVGGPAMRAHLGTVPPQHPLSRRCNSRVCLPVMTIHVRARLFSFVKLKLTVL